MFLHPSLIISIFIAALLFVTPSRGEQQRLINLFSLLAVIFPIIVWLNFAAGQGQYSYEFYNLKLIWEFDSASKLIGSAFLLVLMVSNAYSIAQKKYQEVVIGSGYALAAFVALLAKDFISIFIGIELMMIMSSILIFIGNQKESSRSAKKYFMTHLASSNMILIGVSYIILKNGSSEIVSVTELLGNPEYSSFIICTMLIGMIINVASFPFSGWMVNYYQEASSSGFLYLISFTTKISVILLIKLFSGLELLQYVGIVMIIYSGFKAIFENRLFGLLCYTSIIAMGVMLIGISSGDGQVISAVYCYLFIHIIYKSLLSLSVATIKDQADVLLCSDLGRINSKILLLAISLGLVLMINIPFSLSFYSKLVISQAFGGMGYVVIMLANLLTIISLPWRQYLESDKPLTIKLNLYNKFALLIMIITSFVVGFFAKKLLLFYVIDDYKIVFLKQGAIFLTAAVIIIAFKATRESNKDLNLLEELSFVFFYFYKFWQKDRAEELTKEKWHFELLEDQILKKIAIFHNQQLAIFAAFVLLIVMVVTLCLRNVS